ncbi:hypothetical protein L9Z41_16470 [Leptospira noguchii]|uniref:hypothetical protein n=1 Tax=Leptospira noguchii TaxID=28182 RepID=UPI001F0699DE|nr:hypothetical protein [Leptospira noguchii]MCH1910499.1 hypothetical protein [Leptospira noguchii]MCH1910693.1 hypothetical protein [Leptospira noguchii]MCH1911013.1 hypothetical protein [Leptospira noguchii]MCH1913064.1 hypothetical protein [Leptospira noguchii]MCH1913719.1 hypothetical protein [Leptospira noguchii]
MDALNEIFDLTFEIEELQNKRHEIQEVIFHKIRSHTERLKVIALELTNNSVGDDIFLVSQKHEGWYRLEEIFHVVSKIEKGKPIITLHLGIRMIGKKGSPIGRTYEVRTYINKISTLSNHDDAIILEVRKRRG